MHDRATKPDRLLGVAAGVAALLVATASVSFAQETYRISGDPAAVWNLAGTVTVTGGGSEVSVSITRGGDDAARLEVATGPVDLDRYGAGTADGMRVLYPSDRVRFEGGGETEVRVREDGTFYRGGGDRGRKVKISDDGDGLDAHADLEIRVPAGRTLHVYLATGEVVVSNVDGELVVSAGSADIRASSTSGRLVLDTGSGDVELDGAEGDVTVDTGSGDVTANDVSGPELNVDTGSGDVGGETITVDELGVDTGSGDVTLRQVQATEVSVDTGSGDVRLGFRSSPSEVSVDTGSGNVTLALPPAWEASVELSTSSGEIRSDFRMTVEEMSEDHVRGRVGAGGGSLEVDTGSGDITLERG